MSEPDSSAEPSGTAERRLRIARRVCEWALPAFASLFVLWMCVPFLKGEQSRAWDDIYHQSAAADVAYKLDHGQNPLGIHFSMFGIPGARGYQSLHRLLSGSLMWITGLPTTLVHNWLLAIVFALTPWAYRFFVLRLGMSRLAAGFSGLLCVGSVYGWGNSFEAYYELGVSTQVLGTLFLPLALGQMIETSRTGKGYVALGVLLAITLLSHAAFAAYAAIGCAVVALVFVRRVRVLVPIACGGALALLLAAFWVVPFLEYRTEHKAPPDIITRPERWVWPTAHSGESMTTALVSGRTFDGGRKDDSDDEHLDTLLNMTPTRDVRFPYYSLLTLAGFLLALRRFRDPAHRLLATGTVVGLLLYLGFDDFPFLQRVPVLNQIQPFRIGSFVELFSIALAGTAVAEGLDLLGRLARKRIPPVAAAAIVGVPAMIAIALFATDLKRVVTPLLDVWDVSQFQKVIKILKRAGPPDPEQRVLVKFSEPPSRMFRFALEHSLEVRGGFRSTCNHWTSISPQVNLRNCEALARVPEGLVLSRLMGVRYFVTKTDQLEPMLKAAGTSAPDYRRLGAWGKLVVVEDKRAGMAHEEPGPRVLVVANPSQWYWAVTGWLHQFRGRFGDPAVPWIFRGSVEALRDQAIVGAMDAVIYLDDDDERAEEARAPLAAIAASGKPVLLGMPIEGVKARVTGRDDPHWSRLIDLPARSAPGTRIDRVGKRGIPDRLAFDVDAPEPTVIFLSMEYFDGWGAEIDGAPATAVPGGPDLVSVAVPRGKHRLEFRFTLTPSETATLYLSLLAWLGVLGYGAMRYGPPAWRRLRSRWLARKRPA
jgi:hypothetical protein